MNEFFEKRASFFLYLGAFLCGLAFWRWPTFDPDLGWHLLGGAWIFEHGRVPYYDFINSFGGVWHDYHWLAQMVWYAIYHSFGYDGLRVLLAVLMALIGKAWLDIFILAAPGLKKHFGVLAVLTFVSMQMLGEIVSVRPQMISFLFLAWTLRRLLQAPVRWEIPFLFLLTVLLVNIHVNWIFVPFFWGVFRILPRYFKRDDYSCSPAYLWGGLAFLLSSALISPYGILPGTGVDHYPWLNYVLLLEYLDMPDSVKSYIMEMRPFFSGSGASFVMAVLILMLVAKGSKVEDIRKYPHLWIAGFVGFVLLADKVKMMGIFICLSLPLFAITVWRARQSLEVWSLYWRGFTRASNFAGIFLLLAFCGFSGYQAWTKSPMLNDNSWYNREYLPVDACRLISNLNLKPSRGRDHVRLLTHFNYGGWCRWAIHEANPNVDIRVTTDGRTQYKGDDNLMLQRDLYSITNHWERTLLRWAPDVALARNDQSLAHVLVRLPGWKLLHQDENFAIFVPSK